MKQTRPAISVKVRKSLPAPAEAVYDAWLSTAMVGRFMFGPQLRDERIVRLEIDARVGGHFSFVVERGGQELDHRGHYLELDRPRRLVFSWGVNEDLADGSRVLIEIAPAGAGCELTLTHELAADYAEYAERTEAGWTKMLTALSGELAARGQAAPSGPQGSRGEPDARLRYGVVVAPETLRFERLLPGPIKRVWDYLTIPELRRTWLAGGPMELRLGGSLEMEWRNEELGQSEEPIPDEYLKMSGYRAPGVITAYDPPRLLAFTWDEARASTEIIIELEELDGQVRLVLTHRHLATRMAMIGTLAGWHTHLDILRDRLAGEGSQPFWTSHTAVERAYEERVER